MAKKKRKASPAQLKALAKGRKKSSANRKRKKTSTKGATVARKRRKSTSSKKAAPARRRRKSTAVGRKAPRRRRSSGGGGGSIKGMKGIMGPISEAMIAVAGGILAGVVANKAPIKNEKLKAALPMLAGAGVAFMGIKKKNAMMRQLGTGMMVLGAVASVRKMFPAIPLLAGEDENNMMIPGYDQGQLEYQGDPTDLGYYDEETGELLGSMESLGEDDDDGFGEDELDEIHMTPATI